MIIFLPYKIPWKTDDEIFRAVIYANEHMGAFEISIAENHTIVTTVGDRIAKSESGFRMKELASEIGPEYLYEDGALSIYQMWRLRQMAEKSSRELGPEKSPGTSDSHVKGSVWFFKFKYNDYVSPSFLQWSDSTEETVGLIRFIIDISPLL